MENQVYFLSLNCYEEMYHRQYKSRFGIMHQHSPGLQETAGSRHQTIKALKELFSMENG